MATPHSTANYTLGRGIVSIGDWSGTTPPVTYSDAGNCTEFNLNITEEELDHYARRSGTREKDKTLSLEVGYEGNFILDEPAKINLMRFFKATESGNVLRANTVLDQEYGIRFQAYNVGGDSPLYKFHRVKLRPNGEMGLISDEWLTMDFAFTGLSDSTNNPNSPWFDIEYATTT